MLSALIMPRSITHTRRAVARLHRADNILDRRHIGTIASEHRVAQGHAFTRDYQTATDLLAVGAMIAAMATTTGQLDAACLPFEIGTRQAYSNSS